MWYENFDSLWLQATYEERSSMNRIWYAGDYSVSLRQQHNYGATLARGRLEIRVCNPCEPDGPYLVAGPTTRTTSSWGIFGAGPWLTWGTGNALRLYDLLGAHDVPSRFIDPSWLDADSGRGTDTGAGSLLSWRRRPAADSNIRIVDFVLAPSGTAFTFGMALDPDLGSNAADDESGYDSMRRMVYVWDHDRAVGFLLRDEDGHNALTAVTQYGLHRQPPRSAFDIWTTQRSTQVRLMTGKSDVQLLLTTAQRTGPAMWHFILVKGSSLAEVQARADAAIVLTR